MHLYIFHMLIPFPQMFRVKFPVIGFKLDQRLPMYRRSWSRDPRL